MFKESYWVLESFKVSLKLGWLTLSLGFDTSLQKWFREPTLTFQSCVWQLKVWNLWSAPKWAVHQLIQGYDPPPLKSSKVFKLLKWIALKDAQPSGCCPSCWFSMSSPWGHMVCKGACEYILVRPRQYSHLVLCSIVFCDEHLSQNVCIIKCHFLWNRNLLLPHESGTLLLHTATRETGTSSYPMKQERYYYPVKQEPTPTLVPHEKGTYLSHVTTWLLQASSTSSRSINTVVDTYNINLIQYYAMLRNKLKQAVFEMLHLIGSAKEVLWKWISCGEVWSWRSRVWVCHWSTVLPPDTL